MKKEKVGILETFGLTDMKRALADAKKALAGSGEIKPTKFDLSSTKIFKPWISVPMWLGMNQNRNKVPIYNFFNRVRPPADEAFSVRVTFATDYLGGAWTYDSHLGTDFATPAGTHIAACAPGKVVRIANRFDHGGLVLFIDHGEGLITSYAHLSRSLVEEGETVARGQSVALSGAAGLEMFMFFPWLAPHLHLNTILNGAVTDPFAKDNETSLWKDHNDPKPYHGSKDVDFKQTIWNEKLIGAAIDDCNDLEIRDYLSSLDGLEARAIAVIDYRIMHSEIFSSLPPVYDEIHERRSILDLPFRPEDYDGVLFP